MAAPIQRRNFRESPMSISASGIPNLSGRDRANRDGPLVCTSSRAREPVAFSARASALFGAIMINTICAVVALTGLGLLYAGISELFAGDQTVVSAVLVSGLGAVFAGVGMGYFYIAYVAGPASTARAAAIMARNPNAPWMLRADWARRAVVDRSSLAVMIFLWVWTGGWCGASVLIWTVNRDKILAAIDASWTDAALTSLIPLAGVIGLIGALKVTRTWWRYGASTLLIDTLPGFLGECFRGSVKSRFAQVATRPLEVEIACERRTWRRVRDSDGHWTKEWYTVPVWSATHMVPSDRLQRTKDGVMIPIEVALPAGQPACALDAEGAGIIWSLSVHASEPTGPRYTARFEVPVYARP